MSLVGSKLAAHEPGRVVVEVSSGRAPVTSVADALHRLVPIVDGVEVEAASLPFAASLVQRPVLVSEFPVGRSVAGMSVGHEHALPGLPALAPGPTPLAAFAKVRLVHLDDPVQLVGPVETRQKAMMPEKRRPVADSAPFRRLVQRQPIAQALFVELPPPSKTHVLHVRAAQGVEAATATFRAASEANKASSLAIAHDAVGSAVQADAGLVKLGFAGSERFRNRVLVLSRHFPNPCFLGRRQPAVLAQPR